MKKLFALVLAAVICLSLVACGAKEGGKTSDFPTQNIEILVPFAAGGGLDLVTRYAAEALDIPVSTTVTQMVGGSTTVCMNELINGDQSGHRYMAFHPEAVPVYEYTGVYSEAYSENLTWICSYAYDPMCIAVGKDSPINSWDDLVADAKSRPGEQTWGGAGNNSTHTVGMTMCQWVSGFESLYVGYQGAADARVDAIGGNLDVFIGEVSEMVAYAESGDLKILLTLSEERTVWTPDVPTLAELAGTTENTVYGLHRAIVCTSDVPADVRQYLEDAYRAATTTAEWQQGLMDTLHYIPEFLTGAECDEIMNNGQAICEEVFGLLE